jgi:hypothetical protein
MLFKSTLCFVKKKKCSQLAIFFYDRCEILLLYYHVQHRCVVNTVRIPPCASQALVTQRVHQTVVVITPENSFDRQLLFHVVPEHH